MFKVNGLLGQAAFNTYITEKYGDETTLYSGIHHYESREVQANDGTIIIPSGQRVGVSVKVFHSLMRIHLNKLLATDVAMPKRNIFVLKPIYLNIIFDDIDQIMRNKKGSTQFISETLVRGDDIRLFD